MAVKAVLEGVVDITYPATQVIRQRTPPEAPVSFEGFLDWCDEDTCAEWVQGEVLVMSPASDRHQDICDFLTSVVRIFVEVKGLGWVRSAPFVMRLGEGVSGREPDLAFVASAHLGRLRETYLDGPADLVVEVVSEESIGRDRGEKYAEYEQAGIPEYWLIDPIRRQAEFCRMGGDGHYRLVTPEGGIYRAEALPDFWLRVEWFWRAPLPRVLDVVRELKVL